MITASLVRRTFPTAPSKVQLFDLEVDSAHEIVGKVRLGIFHW